MANESRSTNEEAINILDAISKTTEKIVPLINIKKYRNKWWTGELQKLKTAYKRTKKGRNKQDKIRAKTQYEAAIMKAKQEAWRKFLESVDGQSDVYIKYKILCKRERKSVVPSIILNGKFTSTFEETIAELNKENFPDMERPLAAEHQRIEDTVNQYFSEETTPKSEEEITPGEIEIALAGMKINKAPGHDKLPTIVLKRAWNTLQPHLVLLFNKIFKEGTFPLAWKKAKVIYLKKPGKEGNKPRDFRPIALLSVVSKLYEKVMYNRLSWLTDKHCWIDKDQFGFQRYVSAEHANIKFTNEIFQAFKKKKEVATLFADIGGAFPSVWWAGLLYKMIKKKVPREYMEFMRSYLKDRTVIIEKDERTAITKELSRSVPQGSSIGPWAWSIMFDDILRELKDEEYKAQAFADDLVVYKVKEKNQNLKTTMNRALQIMENWGNKWMIRFSQEKTKTMTFSRLRNTRKDTVSLNGVELENVQQYKYLGLVYDSKLLWKSHLKQQVASAIKTFSKLSGVSSLKWGLKETVYRYIYKNVLLPRITYGALSWLNVIEQKCVKTLLARVQRLAAIAITGTHRTIATSSAIVLAGMLPIHLEIKRKAALQLCDIYRNDELSKRLNILEATRKLEKTKQHTSSIQVAKQILIETQINYKAVERMETEIKHPAKLEIPLTELNDVEKEEKIKTLYTDASKIEGSRVGLAVVQWRDGNWRKLIQKSLSEENSVFRGELLAIKEALQYISNNIEETKQIDKIKSDSRSAIQAIGHLKSTDKDINKIRKQLEEIKANTGKRITIAWVRGHDGIEGNEEADKAAKQAIVEGETIQNEKMTRTIVKTRLQAKSIQEWAEIWKQETTGRLTFQIFKTVEIKGKYSHINSNYDRKLLNRAVSGHFPVNTYLKRIRKRDNDTCNYCKASETIEHLIVHCERFESLRIKELGPDKDNNIKTYLTNYLETSVKILKRRLEETVEDKQGSNKKS